MTRNFLQVREPVVTGLVLLLFVTLQMVFVAYRSLDLYFDGTLMDNKNGAPRDARFESIVMTATHREPMANSLSILLTAVTNTTRPVWDEEIVPSIESERCERYGWSYNNRTDRRRIFAGSLIADDSWHAIGYSAMEAYGIYTGLAFVESNRTQMFYPRPLRFAAGSKNLRMLQSGIFGPDTQVTVNYHVDESPYFVGLIRENMARELILQQWKALGMNEDDLGLIMDIDETYSRDFLRAAQICEIESFRPEEDCRAPKVLGRSLVFETTPECIRGGNGGTAQYWGHPDMIIGKCIEYIGDSDIHQPLPFRTYKDIGWRKEGYYDVTGTGYAMMPNTTQYPLWNAADFRMTPGGRQPGAKLKHTAFHFHNFFARFDQIRLKYETYGHPVQGATTMALGALHEDVQLFVECAMNRQGTTTARLEGGLQAIQNQDVPIALQLESYTRARHQEMQRALIEDEKTYGRRPEPSSVLPVLPLTWL